MGAIQEVVDHWFVPADVARALGHRRSTEGMKKTLKRHHLDFTVENNPPAWGGYSEPAPGAVQRRW
jgi:prophage antirepressor-like protein